MATTEQRVVCPRCRFIFRVDILLQDAWPVEAQCPCCDSWTCFTGDILKPPPPSQAERDAEVQRFGELLWRPINEQRGHRALAWMDRVGNGIFEDDRSQHCWPVPHWIYRFSRGRSAAYIWQEDGSWFVRAWHPLRSRGSPPEPVEVISFEAALDRLVS
jgi:hypothetical protein